MKAIYIAPLLAAAIALRVWRSRRRRRRTQQPVRGEQHGSSTSSTRPRARTTIGPLDNDVALVASRELRERLRGRIFRVGTVLILLVVAGAIIIPTLHGNSKTAPVQFGVVGPLSASLRTDVVASARSIGAAVHIVNEADRSAARRDLDSGRLDVAIIDGNQLLVDQAISSSDSSTTAQFVGVVAQNLGVAEAFQAAGLTPHQVAEVAAARSLRVSSLHAGPAKRAIQGPSIVGLILTFVMLTQYNTWILIGVMEEKSSRVVEVLLATVRPVQLLGGKVLGIGLVAFLQAALIVGFALLVAKIVGSDLLHGSAPLALASALFWLVLGYAFYCWVYAAAGSMAERQDQVQSLAFPLSLPIIFGYVVSITVASTGDVSTFFRVLAYLPLTSPLAMPIMVGLNAVAWWQFLASALISVASTAVVARFASGVYRRAILRTGKRVPLKEAFARAK